MRRWGGLRDQKGVGDAMLIRSVIPVGCLAAALMFGCCRRPPAGTPDVIRPDGAEALPSASETDAAPSAQQLEERWIRAGAGAGGDGTRDRPHGSIEAALEAGAGRALHLRLLAGDYRGAWELPPGTVIEGAPGTAPEGLPGTAPEGRPAARLLAREDATGPLLRTGGALTIKGLTLVGGSPTLSGSGPWKLEEVRVESGGCLTLQEGRLDAEKVTFVATRDGGTCLDFGGEAGGELAGIVFEGPWRVGLALSGSAKVRARLVDARGATWPIRQRGGALSLELVEIAGDGEVGVYVAGGLLTTQHVRVDGYDYGVMAGREAMLWGNGLRLTRAKRAGLAMVGAKVELSDVEVSRIHGESAFGGIQLIGGVAELREVRIHDVSAAGLSQRDGELTLESLSIEGVRASADGTEGAGLSVRLGKATLRKTATISKVGGPGVLIAEAGTLVAPELSIDEAGGPGVVVETGAKLEVQALEVEESSSPALLVTQRSSAKVSRLTIAARGGWTGPTSAASNMIVAACELGAQVHLGALHLGSIEGAPLPSLPCLQELKGAEPSEW